MRISQSTDTAKKCHLEKQKIIAFSFNMSLQGRQINWYLVHMVINKLYPFSMSGYGVHHYRWYTRHHEDCTKYSTTQFQFWLEIREIWQDGTLGKNWPVRPL